jgi:8-amino-3,8-dideoxy-alpha-D-manno-octulosonate transaminase
VRLAIDGGTPVRTRPLAPDYPGASLYGEEEKAAVLEVLERRSPFRYYGPEPAYAVAAFERAFARRMGTSHALAVSSGTAALIVALQALGVGEGGEVLVPANTFIASPAAVLLCGATPVYVDIDETFNLDPSDVERKLTAETVAVMPVPVEGSPCDMDAIMELAGRRGFAVVEDVAQSCGASYRGRPLGSFGDVGVFSFQINKLLTAGEGGMVVTSRPDVFERAVRLHDQGNLRGSDGAMGFDATGAALLGQNYRMSELCGAVLGAQLRKLDALISAMRRVADGIRSRVRELPGVQLRRELDPDGEIGRRIFMMLRTPELALAVERAVQAEGVPVTRLYGGRPVFEHPQLRAAGAAESCPRAGELLARTVTLSLSPLWDAGDVDDVCEAIGKVVTHYREEAPLRSS